jgi:hypothetical protein
MREAFPQRILPRGPHIHDNPRQIGRIGLDRGHLLPGQKVPHGDRDEAGMPPDLAGDAGALVRLERQDHVEPVERCLGVAGLLDHQQRPPIQPIARHHHAEPIDQLPARRRHQPGADPIALGQQCEVAALHDLHLVQLGAEQPEHAHLHPRQQDRAPGKHTARIDIAAAHQACSGSATPRCATIRNSDSSG